MAKVDLERDRSALADGKVGRETELESRALHKTSGSLDAGANATQRLKIIA